MSLRWITLVCGGLGLAAAAGLLGSHAEGAGGARLSRHANGAPRESTTFVEGLRHGPTRRWYDDGTLRAEGEFVNGRMEGDWRWYLPDGTPDGERTGRYEAGRLVARGS
jgi:hypothetical protein